MSHDVLRRNTGRPALAGESRGEAPRMPVGGTEASMAAQETESPASTRHLMEAVCERANLREALKRVQANKGSPGIDGMTVDQLTDYLKERWPDIRQRLLTGAYRPSPVNRVEIRKPDGGKRKLGIPTVLD